MWCKHCHTNSAENRYHPGTCDNCGASFGEIEFGEIVNDRLSVADIYALSPHSVTQAFTLDDTVKDAGIEGKDFGSVLYDMKNARNDHARFVECTITQAHVLSIGDLPQEQLIFDRRHHA